MFSKGHPVTVAALGYTYAVSGRKEDALAMIELLKERSSEEYVSPYWMAIVYAGLNDQRQMYEWLNRAVQQRDGLLVFVKVEPILDRFRSHPRFIQILKRIGL